MQKSSSMLLLLGAILVSMALGIGISLLITHFFGLAPNEFKITPLSNDIDQWYLRMFVQGTGHVFTFLVPAILFWHIFENKRREDFSRSQLSGVSSIWISIAIIFFLIPVNHQIIDWNQNIQLPEIFKEVE